MVVLCGYTCGYTELGGAEIFLRKVRNDLLYKRITPAICNRGKNRKVNPREFNINSSLQDNGLTGFDLLEKIYERFELSEDRFIAKALVILDDTDCKDFIDPSSTYVVAINEFKEKVLSVNTDIEIIFIFCNPEVEMLFNHASSDLFSVPLCKSIERYTNEYSIEGWFYNSEKKSCNVKYSNGFTDLLNDAGIRYSKRNDGSEYLSKISPSKVRSEDSALNMSISLLENL